MWVDDPLELLIAALERHRRDLGDHVAGPVPGHVGAQDLAGAGVDDYLTSPSRSSENDPGAHGGEPLPANLDLVAGLPGLCLSNADARELRVGELRRDD